MYPGLRAYIEEIAKDFFIISDERKIILQKIAAYIKKKEKSGKSARLVFICTHNSRRSHLSQIWAETAAYYYNIKNISTFSGGTETTAFNPRAVAAIERAGFKVENPTVDRENPVYKITFSEDGPVMECFSKKYDHPVNPNDNFAAIMTCTEADENCPLIPGADLRIPLSYTDPKEADATKAESNVYDERCRQIATEMFYLMFLNLRVLHE
ncbi:MAG: low molecular weight phosphatase family protein [Candidatus Cyclobacteriaceae bacterium M2_1C_046]